MNPLQDLSSEMGDEDLDAIVSNLDTPPEEESSLIQTSTTELELLANRDGVTEKSREVIMSSIENTIKDIVRGISVGDPIKLGMVVRNLTGNRGKRKRLSSSAETAALESQAPQGTLKLKMLSLSTETASRALARYLFVLQMIYEAVAYKIVITKRDIYYRDVTLFGTQGTVDDIVSDISCHFGVPRSSLNVGAAAKGLVFGPIIIKLKNNKILDCTAQKSNTEDCNDEQGVLIPPINQVAEIHCRAKYMIVIEKEATFRHLVSVGFCQSLPQSCILVTGKGYPDLSTRQFVKYFSIHYSNSPILALMDNDPHGLDIYAVYKWGARSFAFDVNNLAVPSIRLIGMVCSDRQRFAISPENRIPLSNRDRATCTRMVRTFDTDEAPGSSQMYDRGWRNIEEHLDTLSHRAYIDEINQVVKSGYKYELQSLYNENPFGLSSYLSKKLDELVREV
ncbi:DNA topoisomerase IV, alpha subunit [Backusella circina FSU 941]|nr:DNA topoisomerase IV, alpha subunit [Backusella circina FSU 941]